MPETRTTSSTGGQKGVKLERFDLIPTGPLKQLAEHFGVGASKYADNQWRQGYEWSKTYAALMRHVVAWWNGQDFDVCSNDPEGCSHVDADGNPFVAVREDACFNHTGSHHLAAVAWHAFAGLEFAETHPEHDDRYSTALMRFPQRFVLGIPPTEVNDDMIKAMSGQLWTVPDVATDHGFSVREMHANEPGHGARRPSPAAYQYEVPTPETEDDFPEFGPLEPRFVVAGDTEIEDRRPAFEVVDLRPYIEAFEGVVREMAELADVDVVVIWDDPALPTRGTRDEGLEQIKALMQPGAARETLMQPGAARETLEQRPRPPAMLDIPEREKLYREPPQFRWDRG